MIKPEIPRKKSRPIWHDSLRQKGREILPVLIRPVLLLILATTYDQELVWWFANLRMDEELRVFNGALLGGHSIGITDFILLGWVLAFLAKESERLFGIPRLTRNMRELTARFWWGGMVILAVGLALQLLMARPSPLVVLGGESAFQSWIFPGILFSVMPFQWPMGSFPALGPALIFFLIYPTQGLESPGGKGWRILTSALILTLGFIAGIVGIYSQIFWPSDVAGGLLLALLCGRLFFPPSLPVILASSGKKIAARPGG